MDAETTEADGIEATDSPSNESLAFGGLHDEKEDAKSSAAILDDADHCDDGQSSQSYANGNGMAERLDRELALSEKHRLQLQGHWRLALSKEKFKELRDEIPRLVRYHDRSAARKREVIDALRAEVASLQQLCQDAMVANMNRTEDLIAIHDDRVVKLERAFRDGVSVRQSRFRSDVEQIRAQYETEKDAIRERIRGQAEEDERRIRALRQDHQHELEEIKNRNLEHVNGLRFVMDSRVEDLEEQFELTRGEFAQNADGVLAAHDQLQSKEERMRKEIESKTRQANRLQRELQRFQLIAAQEEAQIRERHEELLARKARAIARWNMTQEAMSKFRGERQERLVALIRGANQRKEALRRKCALAERVRKIAATCRKWESSREEFASLLREASCADDAGGEESTAGRRGAERRKSFVIGCMGRLGDSTHRFWDKYNTAKLDVHVLEREVRSLKHREGDLRDKLRKYWNGITVNNDVLKDRNPLFVINGRMNGMPNQDGKHPGGKKRVMRRLTVVDGNHFFATNNMAIA